MYRRLMPLISSFNMSLYVSSEFNTDVHVVLLHFDETAVNHLFVSAFRVLIDQPSLFECGDDGRVVVEDFELAACAGNDNALHSSVKYHLFGGNDFQIQTHRYKTLMMMLTLGCLKQSLTLSNGVLDGSHVEECLLWQVVYLSVENHVEALDGVLDRNHHARYAGELLGYGERL